RFILQAPPGTGKSQTLTNIISELLFQKKQILFVSEKQAALIDVLDLIAGKDSDLNIEHFCLFLSNSFIKFLSNSGIKSSTIIRNLSGVYDNGSCGPIRDYLGRISPSDDPQPIIVPQQLRDDATMIGTDLTDVEKKLNEYFYELHKIIPPLNKSIFFAYGKISSSLDIGQIDFTFQNAQNCTDLEYNKIIETLKDFVKFVDTYGYQAINSMQNADASSEELYLNLKFKNNKAEALEVAKDGISIYNEVSTLTGYKKEWNFKNIADILNILKIALESEIICPDWLVVTDREATYDKFYKLFTIGQNDAVIKNLGEEIEQINDLKEQGLNYLKHERLEYEKTSSHILTEFDKDILNIDAESFLGRFKTNYNNLLKRIISSDYKKDKERILLFKKSSGNLNYREIVNLLTELNHLHIKSEMLKEFDDQLNDYDIKLFEKTKQLNEIKSINDTEKQIFSENFVINHKNMIDFDKIISPLKPVLDVIEVGKFFNLSPEFMKDIINREEQLLTQTSSLSTKLKNWRQRFEHLLEISQTTMDTLHGTVNNTDVIFTTTISELCRKIQKLFLNDDYIDSLIFYSNIINKCDQLKILNFVTEIVKLNLPSDIIIKSFEKCFFINWLDTIISKNDILNRFTNGEYKSFKNLRYKKNINQFQELEAIKENFSQRSLYYHLGVGAQRVGAQSSLLYHLGVLKNVSDGNDEKFNVEYEFDFTKKHTIPTAIKYFKPCIITSPILVSKFFKDTDYKFDTVIFDEASQIPIENAISSIFRSKQVIIVGDDKQLPPSDLITPKFSFESCDNVKENEELSCSEQFNSILSEGSSLPKKSLTWHYRSKHENLIWFSNNYYYDEKLLTFPSPYNKEKDFGLEYVFVENGTYDLKEDGNIKEANKVADLVIDHIRNYSKMRSLGVIAFTETQQNAILHAIREKLKDNEDILQIFWDVFQDHFFIYNRYGGDNYEDRYNYLKNPFMKDYPPPQEFWSRFKLSFFIRNLNEVQGDERDTIILSVGYA
ncbi:MAG: hypothetical protein LBD41_05025, partial [Clostridiales Family XIII bacterium]|nr:hypothetical protein [Clostridiales Family XIII bacterium]